MNKKTIVIVGGGAGGLELVTRLGRKLGKRDKAKIILIDTNATHIWKPLLHEVAAGTIDAHQDELNYFIHASKNGYHFQLGRMLGLNRSTKHIKLAAVKDEKGEEIFPEREIAYDILVLAFGSITNDFAVPGVTEYALFLDDRREADHFQQLFLKNLYHLQAAVNPNKPKMQIVIVGGGATGVELAAELHTSVLQAINYGFENIDTTHDVQITLIEAADRLLPMLSPRISTLATQQLRAIGVNVLVNEAVTEVSLDQVKTASSKTINASMILWAVGVKAPEFADKLDGLELNKRNQIKVNQSLQTTLDPNIFAFGDCAECPQPNVNNPVPPRAQAANQEASLLAESLPRYLQNQPLLAFHYKDYGSLISLSHSYTLGLLMGKWVGTFLLEGKIARFLYISLYKKHQSILNGNLWVFLNTLSNLLTRKSKPRLKLH